VQFAVQQVQHVMRRWDGSFMQFRWVPVLGSMDTRVGGQEGEEGGRGGGLMGAAGMGLGGKMGAEGPGGNQRGHIGDVAQWVRRAALTPGRGHPIPLPFPSATA
jgi:hypothetical protein